MKETTGCSDSPAIDKILDAERQYAGHGWKTVPLTDGKTPRGIRGWQARRFDADDFRRELSGRAKPGVGVQLGPVSGVIDAEWDNDAQRARLVELCGGSMPDGPEFASKRGGHKLFAWDERLAALGKRAVVDFECSDGSTLKIRVGSGGKGAQSAFPPSPNKSWLPGKSPDDLAIPAAPESLVAALLEAAAAKARPASGDKDAWSEHEFSAEQIADCKTALAALPDAVEGENGHTKFLSACRVIRLRVGNYEQALALAHWFNDEKCQPPFEPAEVERKLNESDQPPRRHVDDDFDVLPDASGYQPFPVDALPEPLCGIVRAGAEAIGCDESFIALPMLTTIAAAIGNSRVLELKASWRVPSILWTVIIGESGTAKSPAFDFATKPLQLLEDAAGRRYAEQMRRFEAECSLAKASPRPAGNLNPPQRERYIVGDITVEALAAVLQNNLRGIALVRDELNGWLGSFDRYAQRGAADESHWLSMFHARALQVDRKTGTPKTIYIPRASVSIAGGIQPAVFRRALGTDRCESGLAARLLMAYPPRRPKEWTEAQIDTVTETAYCTLVNRLYAMQPSADGPAVATLSPEAKAAWIAFYNAHAKEQAALTGELAAAWSKFEEYAARLALGIHYARWASIAGCDDPADKLFAGGDAAELAATPAAATVDVLDAASVEAGVRLVDWFKGEARRFYAMRRDAETDAERGRLVESVKRHGGQASPREVQQNCRWLRERGQAVAALNDLERAGLGQWQPPKSGKGKGVFVLNVEAVGGVDV